MAVRWVRHLVVATVVALALVGALDTHWTGMLLFAPGLGLCFSLVVALVDGDFPREPGSRRAVVYAFVTGCLLVPMANGLVLLGTAGGALFKGLLVLAPFLVVDWAVAPAQPDVMAIRDGVPALSTSRLLHEWRATEDLLRSPRDHVTACEVRALLLDELSRRDPDGVAAWLAAGCDSPEAFIRSDEELPG